RELFLDLDNPTHQEDARAFFEAHEDAMLKGAEVLWPERESYYDLMVMRLVEGETAFQLEKQNNPVRTDQHLFDLDRAGFLTLLPDGILRRDGRVVRYHDLTDLVAYWDPAIGQGDNPDWSACVVLGADSRGYHYLLDAYMSQGKPPESQLAGVAEVAL